MNNEPIEAGSPTAIYRAFIVLLDELLHALDHIPVIESLICMGRVGELRVRFCQYAHKGDK